MRFSLILSSVFAVAAMFFPQYMMRIFTPDSELIAIGTQYLRNISIAYLCWGIIEIYLATLRSVGKVAVATALNTFAFTLNIFLNAVLQVPEVSFWDRSSVKTVWKMPMWPQKIL